MVDAVRRAGAVVWGKSNVPLMLADVQAYNEVYGTTNNPYDVTRTPGGSSGGAAAALAAGVTPLEIGSDIGGSLRHPANFCGVHALKPTWDTLSMRGQIPPAPGTYVNMDLGVVGPMARTPGDLKLLFDVLRGRPVTPWPEGPARVALWLDEPEYVLDDQVRAVVEAAAQALRGEGVEVVPTRAPVPVARLMDSYFQMLFAILMAGIPEQAYERLREARADSLAALAQGADRYGAPAFTVNATSSYREYQQAVLVREELKQQLVTWFADWDAILAPVTPVPAFPHLHEGGFPTRTLRVNGAPEPYMRVLDWIALATATHHPALAAPAGQTPTGCRSGCS